MISLHGDDGPVQPVRERIELLDVLRAFALLGIYVSIIHGFNGSMLYGTEAVAGPLDQIVGHLESLLINKRFIGILSLLFGIGIAIQQTNFREKGTPFASYFLRRMAVLACLGLVNTTFYFNGEILLVYAVFGVLTLLMSRLPKRFIVVFAAVCYLVPAQIFEAAVRDDFIEWFRWFPARYSADQIQAIYTGTDYLAMIRLRWIEYAYIYTDNNFHLAMSLAMILWGYVIGSSGYHKTFLSELDRFTPAFVMSAFYTVLFTLFGLVSGMTDFIFVHNPVGYVFYAVFMMTSMFTYIYVVAFALKSLGPDNGLMKCLINNGKLCLTGYMGGALVYSFIFYGYGAGWYMRYSSATLLAIALVTYAAFTLVASLWLHFFQRGPMEWIYRRLSYGRLA